MPNNSMLPAMNVEPSQPWGGNDPFSMMNNLAEFQNRQNINTAFKLKMHALQAGGEILANAPDLDTGMAQIQKNPDIMGWGGDFFQNMKAAQLLNTQVGGERQKQYEDALGFALKGMIPAGAADWRQGGTAGSAALLGASPWAQGRVGKALKAIQAGLTNGLQDVVANDPLGPEHGMLMAQNIYKTRAAGYVPMGGMTPQDIAGFFPTVENVGDQYKQFGPARGSMGPNGEYIAPNTPMPMPGGPLFRGQAPGYAKQGEYPTGGALGPLGLPTLLGQGAQPGQGVPQPSPATLAQTPLGNPHTEGEVAPWVYSTGVPQGALAGDSKPLVTNSPAMHFHGDPRAIGQMNDQQIKGNDEALMRFRGDDTTAFRAAQAAGGLAHELGDTYDYFAKKTLENGGNLPVEAPGFGAEYRNNFARVANFVGQITGSKELPFNPANLGAIETAQKATAALSLNNAKTQVGGQRETNFLLGQVGLTVPGIENTILGGKILADLTEANATYNKDKYNFMNEYAAHNNEVVGPAEGLFAQQHKPDDYIQGVLSKYGINKDGKIPPESVKNLRNQGYLTNEQAGEILNKEYGMKHKGE